MGWEWEYQEYGQWYLIDKHSKDYPLVIIKANDPIRHGGLIAAAPELAELVLAVEWINEDGPGSEICAWCRCAREFGGHHPDCLRQAALRKAGLMEK